jgi:predicted small secreted protein
MAIFNKRQIPSALLVAACALSLTACSNNDLNTFTQQVSQLGSTLSPSAPPANAEKSPEWGEVTKTLIVRADVDTAAARLKRYYHFTSSDEIAAAVNSGKGNSGWVASAMSEGTDWSAQPGSYYRMSRVWGTADHLTLEVSREGGSSQVIATYRSTDPTHLKEAWTKKLWKQIGPVAEGKVR